RVRSVAVDMGPAVLTERDLSLPQGMGTGTAVSVGNPHLVVFTKDAEATCRDKEILLFADGEGSGGGVLPKYDLTWEMKQDEEGTSIILNGSSFARKKTGLHITVYDPQLNKVIDEVCFSGQNGMISAVRDLDFMNE
ncbi:MAG: hypothetical protein Q4D46_07940, partial [Erysipelotrichaceae bacterium]|nr:hypothetical protein [Erysipelotrichaceae bacterium]